MDGWLVGNVHDWSSTLQALRTQGVTVLTSSGFWQWQAKSVKDEQPSLVRASMKQLACCERSQLFHCSLFNPENA